jgi:hypothetical protein
MVAFAGFSGLLFGAIRVEAVRNTVSVFTANYTEHFP